MSRYSEAEEAVLKANALLKYRNTGNKREVCEAVGISRGTLNRWLEHDEEFARDWAIAREEATELYEAEARRRAVEGWDEAVFQRGVQVGDVRKYSDTLLIFTLKALKPEKYRDRVVVTAPGVPGSVTTDADKPISMEGVRRLLQGLEDDPAADQIARREAGRHDEL